MTDTEILRTGYDRAACGIGIIHIGYGAFHRAHQAVFLDDYMQATGDLRWGIAAVNLRASESADFARAAAVTDGYLLKTTAPDGTRRFRAVRSHKVFVDAARDLDGALDLFAQPGVHAVTMTVTESGYAFNDDWSLDVSAPEVAAELDGGPVQTIYGILAAGLARRAEVLDAPISLLCCDNIRDNGTVLRNALLAYLDARGDAWLADWVRAKTTFPCSMVDRITPRATEALRAEIAQIFPDHADVSIHAEAFTQWVLQDDFAAEMPDLGRVGVQVVANVVPYEEAKIRVLNGGHTGLAYLGALAGHTTFDQAMADPNLRAHFDRWEQSEVLAGLDPALPFDSRAYLDEIADRFENTSIADQLERICMDGYAKMGIYIRPTLRACMRQGIVPHAGYDCVASWVVYARRYRDGHASVPYQDAHWSRVLPLISEGSERTLAEDPNLWGDLPRSHPGFVPDLISAIQRMEKQWPV